MIRTESTKLIISPVHMDEGWNEREIKSRQNGVQTPKRRGGDGEMGRDRGRDREEEKEKEMKKKVVKWVA